MPEMEKYVEEIDQGLFLGIIPAFAREMEEKY
jgi:hypothetical protein